MRRLTISRRNAARRRSQRISDSDILGAARIPVGKDPYYLALSPDGRTVYVAAFNHDQVSVIDAASRQVFSIPVYSDSFGITATDKWVYVAGFENDDSIVVIDRASHTTVHKVAIKSAIVLAHDERGNVYATTEDTLRMVDAASGRVSAPIPVGDGPSDIAIDPEGSIFVSNQGSSSVSVVDPSAGKVVATIPVGKSPTSLAIDSKTRTLYVTNNSSDTVSVVDIDSRTVIDILQTDDAPNAVAIDPEKRAVYVGYKSLSNRVTVYSADSRKIATTMEVGRSIDDMVVDVKSHALYVAHGYDSYISIVEPN